MPIWMALLAAILIMSATAVWFITRRFDYRINFLAAKIDKYMHSRTPDRRVINHILKRIYALIYTCLKAGNTVNAYKAIDVLKLAYGSKLQRDNEYQQLGNIAVAAIRSNQPDIAVTALGAFRPLLKTIPIHNLPFAIEQLTLIAVIVARLKYPFLTAKILENLSDAAARPDCISDKNSVGAILRATRVIGLMALRKYDDDLFRELIRRFKLWVVNTSSEIADGIDSVIIVWLHHLIKTGDNPALEMVTRLGIDLYDSKVITSEMIATIVSDSSKAAGTACLSRRNKVPAKLLRFILELAGKSDDLALWRKAVNSIAQIVSLSYSRRGLQDSFAVFFPILDTGRHLLADELKFGEFSDGLRRQKLFIILKECILVAELSARQQMTSSPGEIITQFYEYWSSLPQSAGMQKSIKRFCQLLLLYWQNTRKRQARRAGLSDNCLSGPLLVSDKDRKRLGI